MCARLGLVATGGSDFHGPHTGARAIRGVGSRVPGRAPGTKLREPATRRTPPSRTARTQARARLMTTVQAQVFGFTRLPGHAQGAALLRGAAHPRALRRSRTSARRPGASCAASPRSFGAAALIDREGARFKALGLRVAGDSPERLLDRALTEPRLLRTPLVRNGGKVTVGHAPETGRRGWTRRTSRHDAAQPFTIHVPDEVLADLRARLARVRWPDEAPGAGWRYGTEPRLHEGAGRRTGATRYDWRAHEARLNRLPAVHGAARRDRPALHPRAGRGPGARCRCCSRTAGRARSWSSSG